MAAAAKNTILADGARFELRDHTGTSHMLNIERRIGKGGISYVWKGTLDGYGNVVVKRIPKHTHKAENYFKSEQKVMKNISSKRNAANVTGCDPLLNCFYGIIEHGNEPPKSSLIFTNPDISDENYYLIYELIDGQNLEEFINSGKPFDHVHLIYQLLNAIYHMHSLHIAHLDIKPLNTMILPDGTLKVIDFGLAQHITPLLRFGGVGTFEYLPPEMCLPHIVPIKGNLKSAILSIMITRMIDYKQTDMYSVGCTLYYLFTGEYLVKTCDEAIRRRSAPKVELPDRFKLYEPFIQKLVSVDVETLNIFQYIWNLDFKTKDDLNVLDAREKAVIDAKSIEKIEYQRKLESSANEDKEELEHSVSECTRTILELQTNIKMRRLLMSKLQHKGNSIGDMRLGKDRYTAEAALHEWCRMHGIPDDTCIIPLTGYQRDVLRIRAAANSAVSGGAGVGSKGGSYNRSIRKRKPCRRTRKFKY